MTMLESFEAALRLDRAALHGVLEQGRPEERIWAIWALAMYVGDGDAVVRRLSTEPDIGVRRTLAVLLAGRGEVDLLVALATDDPALAVRASAMQLVTRLATGGRVAPVVLEAAIAREPEIRIAILGAIGPGAPPFLVAIGKRLLRDRSLEIRYEAFEALLRVGSPSTLADARAWMRGVSDVATVCDHWLRAATAESLAAAFADAAAEIRAIVIGRLHAPAWSALAPLVRDSRALLRIVVERADVVVPARVLAEAVVEGAHEPFVGALAAMLEHAGQGRVLRAAVQAAVIADADDGTRLRALARRVRHYADVLEIAGATRVLDELANQHPVEHLLGLENALATWGAVELPADLADRLPALRVYCEHQLAVTPAPPPHPRQRALPARGAPAAAIPWDVHAAFRRLLAAVEALLVTP